MMNHMTVVAITGAATGIGRAIAERFAENGCKLALAYFKDSHQLENLKAKHILGNDAVFLKDVDVSDRQQCFEFIQDAEEKFGKIDVLITSAGIATWAPTESFLDADYQQLFAVNVNGTYHCIQAALPNMLAQGFGRVITISSEVALVGMPEAAAYSATKGAVISMTKSLAREYASRGILFNSVAPGPTKTPLMDQSPESKDPAVAAAIPIGRFGEPEEIAGAVFMLASKDGNFFCGQVLSPNGGAAI